jgi:hypothetical protein
VLCVHLFHMHTHMCPTSFLRCAHTHAHTHTCLFIYVPPINLGMFAWQYVCSWVAWSVEQRLISHPSFCMATWSVEPCAHSYRWSAKQNTIIQRGPTQWARRHSYRWSAKQYNHLYESGSTALRKVCVFDHDLHVSVDIMPSNPKPTSFIAWWNW